MGPSVSPESGTKMRPTPSGFMMKGDRKSTRLNSSHSSISYAVFCLKKKIQNISYTYITLETLVPQFSAYTNTSSYGSQLTPLYQPMSPLLDYTIKTSYLGRRLTVTW